MRSSSISRFLAFDSQDNLYISETGNHTVRKITPNREVTTLLGIPNKADDGSLSYLNGIAIDNDDNLFLCDSRNCVIWKYDLKNNTKKIVAGVYKQGLRETELRSYGDALKMKFG